MGKKLDVALKSAEQAPWFARTGIGADPTKTDVAYGNNWQERWLNAAGDGTVLGMGVDTSNDITIGNQLIVQPLLVPAVYMMETTAAIVDQNFYIANQAMRVVSISEVHRVLGSSTVSAIVRKCTPGQSIVQGTSLMSNSFNLHSVAETQQNGTLATNPSTLTLAAGDRLAFDITGTTTALAGVCVTVMLQPLVSPTVDITFSWTSNTQLVDAAFFVANERYVVSAVRWSQAVASSGTPTIQLTKDASTNAPGDGTALLTNASNAGFDGAAAIDVPQVGILTATAASLLMAVGDRLALDFTGATTLLAGVVCTVSLTPIARRTELNFYLPSTWAVNTNRTFFIADRNYTAIVESEVHAVAAGGTSTATVTKESGTTAAGSGLALLGTANDLNATANVVQSDLLVTTLGYVNLRVGDRLSYKFNHAVQSSSGLAVTVSLFAA